MNLLINTLTIATAETLINKAIKLDPVTEQRIHRLEGKSISISTIGPAFHISLYFKTGQVKLSHRYDDEADIKIQGSSGGLVATAIQRNSGLGEGLIISGDVSLITSIEAIVHDLDIDWAEPLSYLIGDPIAYQIQRASQKITSWTSQTSTKVAKNTQDYIRFEQSLFITDAELDAFKLTLDDIRMTQTRTQKRIDRLNQCLDSGCLKSI